MTVEQWLGSNNKLGIDIWNRKYRYNNETFDKWLDRVSGGNVELRQLIKDKKFLFGGRALSNRGTGNHGSFFNCYSRGYINDDLKDIMQANTDIALTYKSQGGQGISLSKLRPEGAPIGEQYKSDGIIPFMKMYNATTATISQGGSRKGALMISLDCRHKEVENFITIKSNDSEINKANLSLEVDNKFMNCISEYYKTGEEIVLHETRNYDGHTIEYDITPIKIYKLLCQNSYDWADPAILYVDEFRNYNLMEYVDEYQIETCNPCGEQPLPKNFCCNLGSLNLSEFVINPFSKNAKFDYVSFEKSIYIAVNALDKIIDENKDNHALQIQSDNSINYRNIGLGVFAYANMLMMLGITYGDETSKTITDTIFSFLFTTAVSASVELARSKGSFNKYSEKIWDSRIIKNHFTEKQINEFKKYGIRNCSLISIAPTGSIATMMGRSGGCEPEFAISYKRKTESLNNGKEKYYDIFCKTATDYQLLLNKIELPKYFISSANIDYKDRIYIQAMMQRHVDTAISSTVNLSKETTVEDVGQIYLYAWEQKLKGITIFRDGCKRSGILTTDKPSDADTKVEIPRGFIEQVPNGLQYRKYKLKNACGNLYLFVGLDETEGKIYDIFTNTDGVGGCTINTQANSRLISAGLRGGVPIEYLIEQLLKSGSCPSFQYKRGKGEQLAKGKSCPSAIANVLKDILKEFKEYEYEEVTPKVALAVKNNKVKLSKNKCPECHDNLTFEGGCNICKSCGWSKCS